MSQIAKTIRLIGSSPLMNVRVEERSVGPNVIHLSLADDLGLPIVVLDRHDDNFDVFGAYVRILHRAARHLLADEDVYKQDITFEGAGIKKYMEDKAPLGDDVTMEAHATATGEIVLPPAKLVARNNTCNLTNKNAN